MRWSFRIARVSGIDVRVHVTFALAVLFFALNFSAPHGARGAAFGVLLVCALFACLTLHELGHSLAAQRLGVSVTEILLLPIGGVARLANEPRKPQHELLIAFAGPLVNVAIALLLLLVLDHYQVPLDANDLVALAEPTPLGLMRALFWGNALLAVFNMLPALPMDGGRVLRALLSLSLGRSRATRIAAAVAQVIAIALAGIAFKKDWGPLALVAMFVFVGAAQERAAVRASELLSELRAGEVCDPNAVVFAPEEQVGHVLDTLVRSPQAHFAVFYGKELVGTIGREHALASAPRVGLGAPLSTLMRREFFAVDAGTPLEEVRRRLLELAGRPVVVRSLTGYAGVLGFEDLQRITVVAERLAQAGIRRPHAVPDPALALSADSSPSLASPNADPGFQKHPRALGYLLFTETWERFSFYGMKALLVFYLTKAFQFGDAAAYAIYGSYAALVYATPVLGGLLADRVLGFRKAVLIGGVLMALGHFAMAVPHLQVFYLALALLICGNGLFKPNISSLVGALVWRGRSTSRLGVHDFYMGINLGAFLAPIACGYLGERLGWHWGFGLAGVGMLLGLCVFLRAQPLLVGLAEPPRAPAGRAAFAGLSLEAWVYLGTLPAVLIAWQLVQRGALVGSLLIVFGAAVFLGLCLYLLRLPDKIGRDRLGVALLLTLVSVVFWAFFEQTGTSMSLFTERNVDRSLLGALIPASQFQSVDGLFILLFGPVFSSLWLYLARRRLEPNTPLKFGLGIIQLGLGFAAMYIGARSSRATGIVPMYWLILGYFLHATGELCLSPIGLSMITKLSPKGVTGILMGTWFLAYSFAQYVAALIAQLTGVEAGGSSSIALPKPTETVMVYGAVFGTIGWVALAVGLLLVLVSPWIARRMHGVH